ncbi:MAG: PD-(D/E)XK nuclease family protein, partial [Rikenellaceae bacterium]|nr:PD-(D/E)XK nuclease family protein [Rikenellaceae bacterium]
MATFLGETAQYLLSEFGAELSNKAILFPGQRAARFFSNELKSIIDAPIWEPEYTTIDRLMCQITGLESCDSIVAVAKLYDVYSDALKRNNLKPEPFDRFYAWGEKLLASFDMVDKYMVDAKMLFCNISDLKEIDANNSYLDERQREIIKRFFLGIDIFGKQSAEKSHFVSIWNLLFEIYTTFRNTLSESGLSYSGMIYRQAAEAIKRNEVALDKEFIVIGFNALSASEKVLFNYLKGEGAQFFWDYDDYYVRNEVQEAGLFLRENLKSYPNRLFSPTHNNFSKPKTMQVVSAPTDSLQSKYVNTFLENLNKSGLLEEHRTAIVLTDESLLLPVLSSIPACVKKVNVTMGYPVRSTTEYALIERLMTLQLRSRTNNFYHKDVKGI